VASRQRESSIRCFASERLDTASPTRVASSARTRWMAELRFCFPRLCRTGTENAQSDQQAHWLRPDDL
jgi:hypothetical protein